MGEPTTGEIQQRMGQSYALDRLWRETMGLPPGDTKEQPLRAVIAVLESSGIPYAVIGGVAMQLHSREPRTTLDIDLAVRTFAENTARRAREGRLPPRRTPVAQRQLAGAGVRSAHPAYG
ncbi:MAG: hypothetical protein M3O46_03615, partial [Myxococcota bacterium]|nr:hypothetical protein [Myxococcota bacterium]